MGSSPAGVRPAWVSDEMFPFESRFVGTPRGHVMHYVDEGAGEPVVFVHGNPAWSFEFRHLIAGLRSEFRCVAPDHVGFGLSSRSDRKEDHHPQVHAEAFAALLDELELQNVTLFLTDWGGPIGLDFARRHPVDRWRSELSDCEVHEFADCGHFLAEEAPERVLPLLRAFMR